MNSDVIDIELADVAATQALGEWIGRHLLPGQGVALTGDLGAGKTSLVRGLARGLRVDDPDAVSSPTYLLVIEHPGPVPLLHLDAYLPGKLRAFLEDGGLDYLAESRGVIAVEWADRVAELLPAQTLWIDLAPIVVGGQPARRARLERRGASPFGWLDEWR